jgi:uncharacterized protein YbaR (Trm112 family)
MKRSLMDILACPIDKHHPLELFEINTRGEYRFNSLKEADEHVIVEGILFCTRCFRFYPITSEIPILLPDELREKEKDLEFLEKWRDKIPDKVINHGKPYHL